ncbi:MAG TPA: exosortase family protein XrtF [Flavobacterium sp.]
MNQYLRQYRPFFIFLLKFFGVYIVLTVVYQLYLSNFNVSYEVDGFTKLVARQTETILDLFYQAHIEPHPFQRSIKLSLNGDYLARIVEGCNALSVMILFTAFVVAFSGRLKHTILYILTGIIIIHILNIVRIVLLTIALLQYPEYGHFLHSVVFPLFIYGVVFVLWVIWVNKYSGYARKTA